jgi:multicomponent Na+:H+ antiporter subunit A
LRLGWSPVAHRTRGAFLAPVGGPPPRVRTIPKAVPVSLNAALAVVFALAVVLPSAARVLGRDAGYLGAAVLGGLTLWFGWQTPTVLDGPGLTSELAWLPSIGIDLVLRLDALGLLFALVVLGIGAAVLAYCGRYFAADAPGAGRYLGLLAFFAGSMLGLVLADDVVVLFVFWELTSISSFFLIGGLGEGTKGATRALLVTAIGGLALLAGVVLISLAAGTSSLAAILAEPAAVAGASSAPAIIVLLLLAATTKSAQLPFHFWLPGAMVAPTPVSTYLHAATMVKAGIYLLFRFTPVFAGVPLWRVTLVLVGLTTALFGAVVATKQHDLKALLAYSTISQLGLLTGLIGVGTSLALATAAVYTLAHALFKATLFMTAGIVDHETGTRDLRALGGLRAKLPVAAVAAGLAALSMAGIVPLVGFVAKEELFASFLAAGGEPTWLGSVAIALAVTASVGTFVYSARYYLGVFEGPVRTEAHAAPLGFTVVPLVLAVAGLALGLVVPRLDPLVNAVAVVTTGNDPELHLALWHGLTTPLLLSLLVVSAGLALLAMREPVERLQARVRLTPGSDVFDALYAATLRLGAVFGRPADSLSPAAYLLPVIATLLAVALVATATTGVAVGGEPAPSFAADWAVVVLIGACIAGVVQARSRLGAIAALGMAGFLVAGWFVLLGAPDLALTQLLVETLTIAVVVVVFRRLPPTFARGSAPRKAIAAAIATAVGVFAALATFTLTGRRGLSEIGTRFLAEGESITDGNNVVNTILVDFRALDTLGEVTVIGVATLGIYALVRLVRHDPIPRPAPTLPSDDPDDDTDDAPFVPPGDDPEEALVHPRMWRGPGTIDSLILQTAANGLGIAMTIASVWLLVRGHDAVGGGFIGGLTAGAAVVTYYLSHGHERVWQSRWLRVNPLVGVGIAISTGYGLAGLATGAGFLAGGKLVLPGGISVAASLVFDLGVYCVVVGIVVAIVRHLGQGLPEDDTETDLDVAEPDRPMLAGAARDDGGASQ